MGIKSLEDTSKLATDTSQHSPASKSGSAGSESLAKAVKCAGGESYASKPPVASKNPSTRPSSGSGGY